MVIKEDDYFVTIPTRDGTLVALPVALVDIKEDDLFIPVTTRDGTQLAVKCVGLSKDEQLGILAQARDGAQVAILFEALQGWIHQDPISPVQSSPIGTKGNNRAAAINYCDWFSWENAFYAKNHSGSLDKFIKTTDNGLNWVEIGNPHVGNYPVPNSDYLSGLMSFDSTGKSFVYGVADNGGGDLIAAHRLSADETATWGGQVTDETFTPAQAVVDPRFHCGIKMDALRGVGVGVYYKGVGFQTNEFIVFTWGTTDGAASINYTKTDLTASIPFGNPGNVDFFTPGDDGALTDVSVPFDEGGRLIPISSTESWMMLKWRNNATAAYENYPVKITTTGATFLAAPIGLPATDVVGGVHNAAYNGTSLFGDGRGKLGLCVPGTTTFYYSTNSGLNFSLINYGAFSTWEPVGGIISSGGTIYLQVHNPVSVGFFDNYWIKSTDSGTTWTSEVDFDRFLNTYNEAGWDLGSRFFGMDSSGGFYSGQSNNSAMYIFSKVGFE